MPHPATLDQHINTYLAIPKINSTDGLIDQIVYRLYGLTEDEIKIVEGRS
jgi:hypothetical protein